MRKRKNICPECRSKLTDFGLNVDAQKIECVKCRAQFNPLKVFRDSDIILLSKTLSPENQEKFLTALGFEKKIVHRTPKYLLYCFLSFLMLGTAFFSLILALAGYRITALSPVIGGLLLCFGIYSDYRNEEKLQWRKKEK